MERNLIDILEELGAYVRASDARENDGASRAYALLALGYCVGVAAGTGLTHQQIATLFGVQLAAKPTETTSVVE